MKKSGCKWIANPTFEAAISMQITKEGVLLSTARDVARHSNEDQATELSRRITFTASKNVITTFEGSNTYTQIVLELIPTIDASSANLWYDEYVE